MSYFYKENQMLEDRINRFFNLLSKVNDEKYDNALSIMLLGSLSRGEGSWIIDDDNKLIVLSDIEFFTFYNNSFNRFVEFSEDIKSVFHQVFYDLSSALFHVDNSYCSLKNIKNLERKLLVFDAIQKGITVVGEDAKKYFPIITLQNINLLDIKDILVHRVFSVVYYGFELKKQNKIEEYKYSLAKNSLDLMTVILAEKGILCSGFKDRFNMIREVISDEKLIAFFDYCISVKFSLDSSYHYSINEMEHIFINQIKSLSICFKVPFINCLKNFPSIFRRKCGIIKREIKNRHISPSQKKHLTNLVNCFYSLSISNSVILDNYVLNGYPQIESLNTK